MMGGVARRNLKLVINFLHDGVYQYKKFDPVEEILQKT